MSITVSFECKSSFNAMLLIALHELLELGLDVNTATVQDMSAFSVEALPCIVDVIRDAAATIAWVEEHVMTGEKPSSAAFRALAKMSRVIDPEN